MHRNRAALCGSFLFFLAFSGDFRVPRRASAQDGVPECREIPLLSTERIPETTTNLTDCSFVGLRPRTVSRNVERSRSCRHIRYRKTQNTRQIVLLSGFGPGRCSGMSRDHAVVDNPITGNHKTPDRSPFCRASAQDGVADCREIMQLSTFSQPILLGKPITNLIGSFHKQEQPGMPSVSGTPGCSYSIMSNSALPARSGWTACRRDASSPTPPPDWRKRPSRGSDPSCSLATPFAGRSDRGKPR
ncbi:hypothetical protein SAMN05216375_10787 [Trichococcus ilyis]|uniref:Uncharacterized protein n=1 Tax=Trichococcus ilyis TaxID=640938 RepID=A0A143YP64_9LACT|nr:Hypothetical protein TR210_1262 [Trichococcus ilyis]SEJ08976.1 hypothetical protein SAMN05216375_10787 [Trichococcus ilyis]